MSEHVSRIEAAGGAQNQKLLRVANLVVRFGEKAVLQDVSFGLAEGEFVAIVGPNGAGKTTLLRALLGALAPSSGALELSGRRAESYSTVERACFLSYAPQSREIPAGFSVREFVEMALYAQGYRFALTTSTQEQVDGALGQTGLTELGERFLETLSGGELQRAYLAAALAQGARIMLLDEPTTFLDPAHQKEALAILSRSRIERKRLSALIVTHDLNLAVSFADRILALKDGALVFDGSPAEFCDERLLQKIYQTTMRFVTDPLTGKPLIVPALWNGDSIRKITSQDGRDG